MGAKIAILMFVVASTVSGISYLHYKQTQKTIASLTANNAKLEQAVVISQETIASLQQSYREVSETLSKVNDDFQTIRDQNNVLSDKLQKHDLAYLAKEKPKLVEKIINKASDKALRCFEILTGAKLTESEKKATNGKEFNSECPWVFDSINFIN